MEGTGKGRKTLTMCNQEVRYDGIKQKHRDIRGYFPIYDSGDFKLNPKSALNISALII